MWLSETFLSTSSVPLVLKIWNDPKFRAVLYQVVAVALVGVGLWYLISNTLHNLSVRNIATGFDFLEREAGFAIGESAIQYSPADTYGRALSVGLLNTLRVAVIGIVLATLLGTLIGIARLSSNWLVAKLASIYVEVMRNIPLLLQLFFWYALISETLPGPRQALSPMAGVFLSNRGFKVPALQGDALTWLAAGFFFAVVVVLVLANWSGRRQAQTGQIFPVFKTAALLLMACPLLAWWLSGSSLALDIPVLKGFNFQGGLTLSPEFAALLIGLVIYTAAFVAEVVRSGIESVGKGQWEAAGAIGLRRGLILRLVVLPQALRVIIPPMTSQYLNITKNSSLAVAIGYPDIVSVVNTTLNQTGQAIEGIMIIMGAYLTVSLTISVIMNWYNARMALVER
jgi:general L-amino acid transport system permease protein